MTLPKNFTSAPDTYHFTGKFRQGFQASAEYRWLSYHQPSKWW